MNVIASSNYSERRAQGMIKIGDVARHFRVSVDLLRLYEREGLLIPLRSPRNTRYYTIQDYPWIRTILRLVREARLNFASVRRLLSLVRCHQSKGCAQTSRQSCPFIHDTTNPCWANRRPTWKCGENECYFCPVYRSAPSCENLLALLAPSPAAPTPSTSARQ